MPDGYVFELPVIGRELARAGLRYRFADHALERAYIAEQREAARLQNRITLSILAVIFIAFIVSERQAMPEAVTLSAVLRFAVIMPATILYVVLDWRGLITRFNAPVVTSLLILPVALSTIESFVITSPSALAIYQAVPLLQLALLTCRVSAPQALAANVCSWVLFAVTVLNSRFVPPEIRPAMITIDITVGIATLVFAWQLDWRDRKVFLFTHQATLGRDLLAAQNRTLARLSQVDALTGLGNRRCFDDTLQLLWRDAAIQPFPVTLVMFDIDCFKQFNDLLGHQAGDECLGALARAVSRCLRDERDTLVRYGGEEFAVILPHTAQSEGEAVAERIRQAVLDRALPHPAGGPLRLVTVSLGVATVTAPAQSAASLIEGSDRQLYAAKHRGRNRVEAAHPEKLALEFDVDERRDR